MSTIRWDGINIHTYIPASDNLIFKYLKKTYINFHIWNTLHKYRINSRKASDCTLRLHEEHPFDIIQCTNTNAIGYDLSQQQKVKIITRLSGISSLWHYPDSPLPKKYATCLESIERKQVHQSYKVFSPSKLIADIASKRYQTAVDVIRSPFVPCQNEDKCLAQSIPDTQEYLLFFGTHCLRKGIHHLIKVIPSFLNEFPKAQVIFAGKDNQEYWKKRFISLHSQLQSQVHFLGPRTKPELFPIIKNARLIAMPSVMDNLPNTLIESMSLGKAIVATRGATFDEIIQDRQSGYLYDPNVANSLLRTICYAWMDPNRTSIEKQALRVAKLFDPAIVAKQLEEYYLKC